VKPLCIDLFCGLGGWTEGFLAEGWDVIGFDIEQHVYGEHRYPAQLVLQDVRTLHGSQFKDAQMIVASSPCQEFSYRAMPWKRAKALPPPYFGMELFSQAARIQKEACEAAGRHIPMIQENVRGAQPWVGRAQAHFGSFYLWGDIPALMPIPHKRALKGGSAMNWAEYHTNPSYKGQCFRDVAGKRLLEEERKHDGSGWRENGTLKSNNRMVPDMPVIDEDAGTKGYASRLGQSTIARHGSKSSARKAASARIAKIPLPLARYIAQVYYPQDAARSSGAAAPEQETP